MEGDDCRRHHERHVHDQDQGVQLLPTSTLVNKEEVGQSNSSDNIPLGYKFCPTDSEAFTYLIHKVYRINPINILLGTILEFNIYQSQPSHLPVMDLITSLIINEELNKGDGYCYYFTQRDGRFSTGTSINRGTKDGIGYWRITSKITEFREGKKNTLVYYRKAKHEKGKGQKTNWIMHEYVLNETPPLPSHVLPRRPNDVNDVVLCRFYERKQENEEDRSSSGCLDMGTKDTKHQLTSGAKRRLGDTGVGFDQPSHDNQEDATQPRHDNKKDGTDEPKPSHDNQKVGTDHIEPTWLQLALNTETHRRHKNSKKLCSGLMSSY